MTNMDYAAFERMLIEDMRAHEGRVTVGPMAGRTLGVLTTTGAHTGEPRTAIVTWTRDDTAFSRTFAISGPTFFDASGVAVLGTGRWTTPMVDAGWVLAAGHLTFDGTQDGFALIKDSSIERARALRIRRPGGHQDHRRHAPYLAPHVLSG